MVYLTGGLANVLVERLRNRGVDCLLREYGGVIVGRSAGALALCRKSTVTCRSNSKAKIIEGIGLVDFTLKVHYKPEKDDVLARLSAKEKIYAVPESSALVCNKDACSFIGNVYLFEHGKKRVL